MRKPHRKTPDLPRTPISSWEGFEPVTSHREAKRVTIRLEALGFYSHLCFITHATLLIATLAAQLVAILALFSKEKSTLFLLKSPRDPREVMVLGRLECGLFMAIFMLQVCD
ncbi:hypothetical protein R6Q59_016555 [Mikania micrantha]